MRPFLSFPAAILAVAGPVAAQPFSQSMVQCAGLFEAVQKMVPGHESITKIEAAAAAFSQPAVAQARAEGQDDPQAWVERHRGEMRTEWDAHGGLKVFSQDFVDRTDHCRALADDRGIGMDFD
ncbi:MAG TPA: hypothetical protein DIU07_08270 [Rhodobacteraceae bacterium]|nr:hypothetical protein [Paracoccaceae bacterium]